MKIDDDLIESLLFEEESDVLDFKREQYRFIKASDDDKSELLKDILAFANAWRRTDAFILIGVEEVKGARSKVIGVSEQLDDAAVQQFVYSKTQKPIDFSYKNTTFAEKRIAVIHIPCQNRPFYILRNFGKIKASEVYIRRGSSTVMAKPDEIARMGISSPEIKRVPDIEVFFSNPSIRRILDEKPTIESLVLIPPPKNSIPDFEGYTPQNDSIPHFEGLFDHLYSSRDYQVDYYRELVEFTVINRLVSPLYLAVRNSGEVPANDLRIELSIPDDECCFTLLDDYDYPSVPRDYYDSSNSFIENLRLAQDHQIKYDTVVRRVGNLWLVEARTEKVQPKAVHWFQDPFYFGSSDSSDNLEIRLSAFADNLEEPHQQSLLLRCNVEKRKVDLDDVLELEIERFRSSPEFDQLPEDLRKNI